MLSSPEGPASGDGGCKSGNSEMMAERWCLIGNLFRRAQYEVDLRSYGEMFEGSI